MLALPNVPHFLVCVISIVLTFSPCAFLLSAFDVKYFGFDRSVEKRYQNVVPKPPTGSCSRRAFVFARRTVVGRTFDDRNRASA